MPSERVRLATVATVILGVATLVTVGVFTRALLEALEGGALPPTKAVARGPALPVFLVGGRVVPWEPVGLDRILDNVPPEDGIDRQGMERIDSGVPYDGIYYDGIYPGPNLLNDPPVEIDRRWWLHDGETPREPHRWPPSLPRSGEMPEDR